MFSHPSQVPMSLISPPASPRGLPLTIVDAEGAPTRSPAVYDASALCLGDFVLDESFNVDFLLQSQYNKINSTATNHATATAAAAASNEPQMNLEPLGFQFDADFFENLDVNMLISEAEAAVQSPSAMAAVLPSDQVQLEVDPEFESLLESIGAEFSAQDDAAAVNSPSAEITYSHLAMTPSLAQEETWSSSDIAMTSQATAAFQTDETTSSSFATTYDDDDDDARSIKESSRGRGRVRSGPGSVSKPYKSKKESNKAAAERYRNKKQNEKKELFAECERHEQRNRELKAEIDEVQAELNFIKNLLVEALLTKQSAKSGS